MFRQICLYKGGGEEHLGAKTAPGADRVRRALKSAGRPEGQMQKRRRAMDFSGRFKDLVRRLAVTLFGVLEVLGFPRIPEKKDTGKGDKG